MPGSVTSTFSEREDFEAALREEGCLGMLITGRGQFRAQLTRVMLHRMRLSAAEEQLSRIAFIAVPAGMILMSFAIGEAPSPIWGGIGMQAGEIMALGPGERVHARTDGACRWGTIWLPHEELVRYGRALTGAPFAVSPVPRHWRPPPAAGRDLRQLYAVAIRTALARPQALADAEAAHGLEQQLVHAVVDCLPAGPAGADTAAAHWHRDIMSRYESLLETQPDRNLRKAEICAALGVDDRLLRSLCTEHLGMSPAGYLRLRRMSLVRRALGGREQGAASVSEAARRYGFRERGRFAAGYRALFGELPSVTLRRSLRAGTVDLARHRPRLPV
jgi:AraC-like DNA-binding protein